MSATIPFDNSYARLPDAFHARVGPVPVRAPRWIAFNRELAEQLGLDPEALAGEEGLEVFAGNRVPAGAEPIALAYAGHQFGGFSPRLGDGRALLLGEVVGRDGVRRDIQLKGSGPTPFSRRGDGRSALGPVLREYLVSEAMAALGVPTTRALAAVWSGEAVLREEAEPGGVFTRVAQSHLRVGTFEYFAARGETEHLAALLDYAVARHFPEAAEAERPALALLAEVQRRQARLVAQWMGLGFIHGVMNTDNTSISGETIDYGPCAFLDGYDPEKKFSFIDQGGRYAFGNQPAIAHWNLARLAEALLPLIGGDEESAVARAREVLEGFPGEFRAAHEEVLAAKAGCDAGDGDGASLVRSLLDLMEGQGADFTLTFRWLGKALDAGAEGPFLGQFERPAEAVEWLARWRERIGADPAARERARERMAAANPVFIPRNHRIEEAIRAGREGDFAPFHRLGEVLRRPFEEQPGAAEFERPPQPHEEVRATFCGT